MLDLFHLFYLNFFIYFIHFVLFFKFILSKLSNILIKQFLLLLISQINSIISLNEKNSSILFSRQKIHNLVAIYFGNFLNLLELFI